MRIDCDSDDIAHAAQDDFDVNRTVVGVRISDNWSTAKSATLAGSATAVMRNVVPTNPITFQGIPEVVGCSLIGQ